MTTTSGARGQPQPAIGLAALLDFATVSHARAVAVLAVVALLAFLPGFSQVPPIDRDETRFAQATKQMIESGDYVDIRYQDEVRYKKPVGIYWLQAAAVKTGAALGVPNAQTTIWLYRIPSLLGALGVVLLTYWTALAFVTRRGALLAGIMMATCVLMGVEARLAKTDAMLVFTIVAAMGALARIYLAERRDFVRSGMGWPLPTVLWTALAAGVLMKGPLILLFVGLTAAALAIADRSARWLWATRPLAGIVWLALLVLPWFLAILNRAGDSFFVESVGNDMLAKVFTGQESHGAPPGFFFVLFWVTFWPGAVLAGLAAPAVWGARGDPAIRFLLAWLVPAWLVFEIVVTKLPHYVLPVYPAAAILIAWAIESGRLSTRPWLVRGTIGWFLFPAAIAVVGIAALIAINLELRLLAWPFLALAVVFGLLAWWLYEADGAERSLLRAALSSILIAIGAYQFILPSLRPLFPSPRLAAVLRQSGCPQPQAAAVGYHEPSLVFLAGTGTRLTDVARAAEFLRGASCRFALVDSRQERAFGEHAQAIGLRYSPAGRVDGFNLGGGRSTSIGIYRSEGSP